MANIPELLDGHVTLEVECLDRLYLNGYIGGLATPGGLVTFMRLQLGKPIPSPVVLGQVSGRSSAEAVKARAGRQQIPIYQFQHKERKDDLANEFRRQRGVRDEIVFIGVAQEKAKAFSGAKVNGQFQFNRDKTVYVNHYYFYMDDEDFGPLFIKVCSYAPWGIKLCINGQEWAKRQLDKRGIVVTRRSTTVFFPVPNREKLQQICDSLGPEQIERLFPEMAEAHSVAVASGGPAGRLRLGPFDLAKEVSLTQIFDRPLRGREFFQRDHPRQSGSGTAGSCAVGFRPCGDEEDARRVPDTPMIQDGVHPSLHINYKNFDLQAVLQRRTRLPAGKARSATRTISESAKFVQPALPAETGTADQSAPAG